MSDRAHPIDPALLARTLDALDAATRGQERIALAFSGGKDALACLELLRMLDVRPVLLWAHAGAALPHMKAFIRRAAEGMEFMEVRSDQAAHWRAHGIPSQIVPMFNHAAGQQNEPQPARQLISDWYSCHLALLVQPLYEAVDRTGATLLVHGQRKDDGLAPPRHPHRFQTITPLWDWTAADVFAFLRDREVELPAQYPDVVGSLECWNCPLPSPDKVRYLKRAYPERAAALGAILTLTHEAVRAEVERSMLPSLAAFLEPGGNEPNALKKSSQPQST